SQWPECQSRHWPPSFLSTTTTAPLRPPMDYVAKLEPPTPPPGSAPDEQTNTKSTPTTRETVTKSRTRTPPPPEDRSNSSVPEQSAPMSNVTLDQSVAQVG